MKAVSDSSTPASGRFSSNHIVREIIISGAIIVLIAIFLVSQASSFAGTFEYMKNAPLDLMLLALLLTAGTYFAAAVSYVALGAARNIRLKPTLVVQTASGITNRILPAGLGGAGLYAVYMKRSGFNIAQSTAIVATNNTLGALGNALLLVLALVTAPKTNIAISPPSIPWWYVAVALVVITAVVVVIVARGTWRKKIKVFAGETFSSFKDTIRPGKRSAISLASNLALTALNGVILSICIASVDASMYWPLTIAVLSLGALLGAAVPTPGGVGGVEAGIVAGLIACGVPAAPALAATLLYRGVTYWLPIIPGLIVLPWVRKHYLY